jgi:hypothetical protein
LKIRPTTRATAAALTLLATSLAAAPAQASDVGTSVPCATTLPDASGSTWSVDAFTAWSYTGNQYLSRVTAQDATTAEFLDYENLDGTNCTTEHEGHEVIIPNKPTYAPGLIQSRKLYTSVSGTGVLRQLDTFHNTTAAPITFTVRSERLTTVVEEQFIDATSSGDTLVTDADRWTAVSDGSGFAHSHIWQGVTARHVADWLSENAFGTQLRWTVTVPANSAISLLVFATKRPSDDAGKATVAADAALIAAATPTNAIFEGLTKAERAQIINFNAVVPPPVATLRVRPTISRTAFLAGMPIAVNCSSRCTARIRLIARATSEGRLMATRPVLLDEVTRTVGTVHTGLKLYPTKRLVISRTGFTAYVKLTVTDAYGNTTTTSAPIRVS